MWITVSNVSKKPIPVYLDPPDRSGLEDLAEKTGRGLSSLIREAVKNYLRDEERT